MPGQPWSIRVGLGNGASRVTRWQRWSAEICAGLVLSAIDEAESRICVLLSIDPGMPVTHGCKIAVS